MPFERSILKRSVGGKQLASRPALARLRFAKRWICSARFWSRRTCPAGSLRIQILIQRSVSLGEEVDTKRRQHRTVRLLAPLAADLRLWHRAAGRPDDDQFVVSGRDGQPWTQAAYQSWRRRAFHRATQAAGLANARPYDLRHSFASLLLHEGRSVIYVARQLGHDARLPLTRYGHVMDELEDTPRLEAEVAIAGAQMEGEAERAGRRVRM